MGRPLRVLIIEDSEDDTQLLLLELRESGYEVEFERVETAEAMRAMLSEKEWDLILSDYSLPRFSAPKALEVLKASSSLDLPFIIVSGTIGEETAVAALKAGANDFLVKGKFARLGPAIERELREAEIHRDRKRAEDQNNYHARLLRYINDAVIATDDQFHITAWNRAAERIYGWTAAEVMGHSANEVLTSGLGGEQRAEAQELLSEKSSFRSERIHSKKNGQPVYVEENTIALTDKRGTITGYVSVNRDISERKQAEEALREKERLLSEAQSIGHVGSWSYNVITNSLQYSDEMYRLLDVSPREFPHTSEAFLNLIHPSDHPAAIQWMDAIRTGRLPSELNFRIFRKNGELRYIQCRGAFAFDSSDKSVRFTGMAQDITERKQAEKKIGQQLERLTALREIDQAITSTFDVRMSLDALLSHATKILVVDAAAVLLLDPVRLTLEYGAGIGFLTNAVQNASVELEKSFAGKVALEQRIVQIPSLEDRPDDLPPTDLLKGEDFVSYHGAPLIVKGKVLGVLEVYSRSFIERDPDWLDFFSTLAGQAAIAIDNAQLFENLQRSNLDLEHRVAERTGELNRTNAELEQANRAKDEFLANMSHELRTPLNSILGMTESLMEQRRGLLNERQLISLQVIESSGRHLLELINDILDLSKIEAGMLDYYPQIISVDEICKASLGFVRSQALKKAVTLIYNNEAAVSNISADPRRLKQILVNLCANAIKFTPDHGRVTLEVRRNPEQECMQFSVIDTGIGIAPDDLVRLFTPFVQVDSNLNRRYEGTGLGLALIQKLTDLHGGSVQVESEVGKGSRFTINLPWVKDMVTRQEIIDSGEELPTHDESEKSKLPAEEPLKGGVILLAEDNMANVLTIGEYLEIHGYTIVNAHDGLEAIQRAGETNPDVILMDIQMPVMDGLEAMRRLRSNPRFASTPIIALTALAMPGDRERCLKAGATEYMSKPVGLKLLAGTIAKLLDHTS